MGPGRVEEAEAPVPLLFCSAGLLVASCRGDGVSKCRTKIERGLVNGQIVDGGPQLHLRA